MCDIERDTGARGGSESIPVEIQTDENIIKSLRNDSVIRITSRPANGVDGMDSQVMTSPTENGGLHYLYGRVPSSAINDGGIKLQA